MISILICSLHERRQMLDLLLKHIYLQVTLESEGMVEVLHEVDNGEITTGAKRNKLLQKAKGKYVIFVDDDDWVYPYYIRELLWAAESDADCFQINGVMTTDGHSQIEWRLSKDYPNTTVYENGKPIYLRTTNHITAVRKSIALMEGFPDKSNAEDKGYSDAINKHLKTEFTIIPPMYHYRFLSTNKKYK